MGRLADLIKDYKGTGVQLLGMCADVHAWGGETGDDALHYIEQTGANYPHLGSTGALTGTLSYIPSTHMYDSTGTMIAAVTGEHSTEQWINIIETLMAKQ